MWAHKVSFSPNGHLFLSEFGNVLLRQGLQTFLGLKVPLSLMIFTRNINYVLIYFLYSENNRISLCNCKAKWAVSIFHFQNDEGRVIHPASSTIA